MGSPGYGLRLGLNESDDLLNSVLNMGAIYNHSNMLKVCSYSKQELINENLFE